MVTAAAKPETQLDRFNAIIKANGWHNTPEIVAKLDDAEFWDQDFRRSALAAAKAAMVRKLIRAIKDADGFRLYASIEVLLVDGSKERQYKHEDNFTAEDYIQVVNYHHSRMEHHKRAVREYVKRAEKRFGRNWAAPKAKKKGAKGK